ncbi:hypothetical protein [Lichenifustis flavocetrariae]|uniref:Uncharacterized protein n=1 Tax=Lichenifustis flavocetrariae TaxID=2949735 RepID=A0AA41Z3E4_9HYPH|nr:hypothetical protein [Lichenifustis flavocetrariae]MCW6512281.1 hypothetical protein [Lichenifustis flavocetrariae]
MAFLICACWFFAATVGGLILNILATDVYERCPWIAAWILERAVKRLPDDKRARYREEWASHLADCTTKLDQIWHAAGSWWSVGSILRRAPHVTRRYRLDLLITGSALVMVASTGEAVVRLLAGMPFWFLIPSAFQIVPAGVVVVLGIRLRWEKGNIVEL